jgi:hypothetical protein
MERAKKAQAVYREALKRIGPENRLRKAFELSELTKSLFIIGLKKRYPDVSEEEFRKLLFEKLERCRNQNY